MYMSQSIQQFILLIMQNQLIHLKFGTEKQRKAQEGIYIYIYIYILVLTAALLVVSIISSTQREIHRRIADQPFPALFRANTARGGSKSKWEAHLIDLFPKVQLPVF
jgi:hypothetical protein